ncbi:HipA domain-containing protein [Dehalobacterium formicoaceticum]|uniref:HipA domain-containing protein n=1 Tax=Dehalobacterium formicoaceticum TaxID=51515 RepID=A0ABT1Y5B4_9FIRM|nr:HipA domain-containing protein [Dehalobacterium formicoaceticum]MCR6546067.1 HipA domain-containing protein [Dehalobacterium formicoaceticum]
MIDFTSCEINKFKAYGGANGNKINIIYEGESYMLKFPPVPSRNKFMSYTNGCISEYIACNIFKILGIITQETILGTYTDRRGKEKIVVACKDFTADGKKLMEFAHLKNTCIDSEQSGYGKELSSILKTMEEQTLLPPNEIRSFFWDMFIVDALLGNFDRHNGNWGLLIDEELKTVEIAPVYDCGSCLYPQLSEEGMKKVLDSDDEINQRIFVFPASSIEEDGKKISYFDFISSLKDPECNKALKRISQRINIDKINELIDGIPAFIPIQKDFYKVMITERKKKILDFSMDLLIKQEKEMSQQDETTGFNQ